MYEGKTFVVHHQSQKHNFVTQLILYVGEGTPSLAEPATIQAVIDEVARLCHLPASAEIDLEANPSSAGKSIIW